jgi:hypothetical protein
MSRGRIRGRVEADGIAASWPSCTLASRSSLARTSMSNWHVSWRFSACQIRTSSTALRGRSCSLVGPLGGCLVLSELTLQTPPEHLVLSSTAKASAAGLPPAPSLRHSRAKTTFLSTSSQSASPGTLTAGSSLSLPCAIPGSCRANGGTLLLPLFLHRIGADRSKAATLLLRVRQWLLPQPRPTTRSSSSFPRRPHLWLEWRRYLLQRPDLVRPRPAPDCLHR